MRVFEVVEPLRDQVETGKADNRFLSESKAAALKELAQVKDELAKQIGEKNRLVKSDQEKARGLKDAEEQIKKKEFKKVWQSSTLREVIFLNWAFGKLQVLVCILSILENCKTYIVSIISLYLCDSVSLPN